MQRDRFEQLSLKEVLGHARCEGSVQRGKPLYHNRPWSQLLDEMDEADAPTVGALHAARIDALHAAISRPKG